MIRQPDYDRAAMLAYRCLVKLNVTKLPVRPLEILRRCRNTVVYTYRQAAEYLRADFGEAYPEAETVADIITVRDRLTEVQYEIVRAFGSCIGKSNEALQLKHLEYYSRAMRTATEKQKAQMQKNIKLYRTLGFSVGAAILILVI